VDNISFFTNINVIQNSKVKSFSCFLCVSGRPS